MIAPLGKVDGKRIKRCYFSFAVNGTRLSRLYNPFEKDILRLTAKKSSAKFNAYLTACWIFDRYGTTPKGIRDPTKPAAQRDIEGYLIDATGKRYFEDHGKPTKNRYHAKNIAAGQRVDNEARKRELTRACFPKKVLIQDIG